MLLYDTQATNGNNHKQFARISALAVLCGLSACATTPDPVETTPPPPAQSINLLRIVTPVAPALCDSEQPWSQGVTALPNQAVLKPNECFGIELSVSKPVDIFLFNEDAEGRWQYIPPRSDGSQPYGHLSLQPGQWLQFPINAVFDVGSSEEHLHVIAVESLEAVDQLNRIVSESSICCDHQRQPMESPRLKLQAFQQQFAPVSDWRSISVRANFQPRFSSSPW